MWYGAVGVIVTLTLGLLIALPAAEAQQVRKVPRLGVVFPAELPSPEEPNLAAFRQALRDHGYVEGQTVALEYRYALGKRERFPDLIAELVRLQVDILVVGSGFAAVAAKQATEAIPIVFLGAADPVGSGLVASLARPGRNITGLSFAFSEGFGGKWVEILKQAVPEISHVAFLDHADNRQGTGYVQDIQSAAQALGLTLQSFLVSEPEELDSAFALMTEQRAGALIVSGHFFLHTHHNRIVDLAAKHRLPAMYLSCISTEDLCGRRRAHVLRGEHR